MLKSSKNTKDDPCPAFLKKLADLSGAGRIDAGVDEVIDYFESLFAKGDWYSSNKTLAHAEVSGLDTAVSLAMLSMTLVEKRRLSAQGVFLASSPGPGREPRSPNSRRTPEWFRVAPIFVSDIAGPLELAASPISCGAVE